MSLIEIITLIAMVLVAGGVSSRLVELIKSARWSGRAKMQVWSSIFCVTTATRRTSRSTRRSWSWRRRKWCGRGGWRGVCE